MTINQILDKIFVSYKNKSIKEYPAIQKMWGNLIDLKMKHGGNTKVDNEKELLNIIETGVDN